jgi:6-phosphogluconate dehydrogenase
MNMGIVGLGRMGMGIGTRLVRDGHAISGFDVTPAKKSDAVTNGISWMDSIRSLAAALPAPKIIWLMVPSGQPVDDAIADVLHVLSEGDVIIDGGNSYFKDSIRRSEECSRSGVSFIDCGVSGGVWGLEEGFCLMAGGDKDAFDKIEPILKSLAPKNGYRHVGPSGAGHFVKMVHNGVEYGMLQAYGEGFEIMHASQFDLDLKSISELWNSGSVVRSWLLELATHAFDKSPNLDEIAGWVEDTGEGRWTVQQAIDSNVPAPVITLSLLERLRSRQPESFSAKVIAALRQQFGGHAVKREEE